MKMNCKIVWIKNRNGLRFKVFWKKFEVLRVDENHGSHFGPQNNLAQ